MDVDLAIKELNDSLKLAIEAEDKELSLNIANTLNALVNFYTRPAEEV